MREFNLHAKRQLIFKFDKVHDTYISGERPKFIFSRLDILKNKSKIRRKRSNNTLIAFKSISPKTLLQKS